MNLSFKIGTSHIYLTDTNGTALEDVKDGVDARAQNDMNETLDKDVKDGVESRAMNDDINGKSHDICHGQIYHLHSGYSGNCIHNLGNPNGIHPDNKCIVGLQENISSDNTLGEEAIGQHVKTNGKSKGIRYLARMTIIAEPIPVTQIHSGVKCKGNSSHI